MRIVRSGKNLNCHLTPRTRSGRAILHKYMDYLEDRECLRFKDVNKAKIDANKELKKLVPVNFKISVLPAFFNHID